MYLTPFVKPGFQNCFGLGCPCKHGIKFDVEFVFDLKSLIHSKIDCTSCKVSKTLKEIMYIIKQFLFLKSDERNSVFATNSNLSIPIFIQPGGVNL